jgi:hypothetical protein
MAKKNEAAAPRQLDCRCNASAGAEIHKRKMEAIVLALAKIAAKEDLERKRK